MEIEFKIGDFVKINENLSFFNGIKPLWFSKDTFQIMDVNYNTDTPYAKLNKNLPFNDNIIALYYLLPATRKNREQKLNKIFKRN